MLRGRRLDGMKFVRQCPIGPYYADFACRELKIVIEVDGGTHSNDDELQRDRARAAYLEARGFRIFRARNQDVYDNLGDCVITLLRLQADHHGTRSGSLPEGAARQGPAGDDDENYLPPIVV